ncbi:efflux RND transporter periplasmic adaptor subunit [Mucilaginibacter aquaedulcis]|uniref:efflux RND transporter periplasmic adaptor subunit n=1 Tax=Mucilaginibacter aquaedulcis TaxID=1187081 RepID=UPI0025B3EFDB|nr:efflux RND transporter periplasmic adaptor subunit [Mucilaginibacter aquaedulcis]MDN3549370.1 efflux RND transporter periplasmic adaptor subunit [Mucilaginibacter aquaedulcis]
MNNLKNKSTLMLAVLAVAISSLLSACHSEEKEKQEKSQEEQQQEAVETPSVQLVPVKKGKLSTAVTIPGELIPYQQVDLYAKVNSYVKKLLVDIGSEVHQGQLLVVLEAPEINSQLAGAQSRIKQQEAIYFASKATYDRLVSTSKTPGTVSLNDLEQAEAKKNSDLANVEAAKSAYREVSANLAYLEIRAPFDGVITSRNVNLGAYVGPGGKNADPLFTLQDQKRLRLVVSIPEVSTGSLSNKSEVNFTVKALPNQKFTAQVKRMAGALDEKLRSERLEMDVYNKDKKLLPHMFAEVNVPLPGGDSTFVVPKTAVVTSTEKVFVIRVVNHKAQWVDAKKGFSAGDMIEVFGDLKADDQLVKAASDEIRDGSTVKDK